MGLTVFFANKKPLNALKYSELFSLSELTVSALCVLTAMQVLLGLPEGTPWNAVG